MALTLVFVPKKGDDFVVGEDGVTHMSKMLDLELEISLPNEMTSHFLEVVWVCGEDEEFVDGESGDRHAGLRGHV